MSSTNNYGAQRVTLDFKSPLKGSYFTEQLYSIIKPGVYKGLEVSIAQINTGGNKVDITKGQAFLNCIFELETTRSVKVQFQTDIKSYLIEQSVPNKNEIVYLIYEYQEVTENWVEILNCSEDTVPPANAIILAECIYDINGDIIDISYSKRQNGLLNSDDNYSLNDDNIFSNVLDSTKKFKFSASGISGTDIVRTINIPDHDYSLNTIPNWIVDTRYKQNEVIVFENSLYRCVTEHTSLDFFSELNSSYWKSITSILEKTIVKGYNNTGSQLNSGRVIKLAGDFPTQEIPEISLVSDYLDEPYGVVIDNISDLNTGKIIQRGRLDLFGIYDFSSGSIGQKIYCDNSGNLTLSITQLIVGQLLDPVNTIVYIAILPAEEGLNVINFDGQLSVNETSVQKAFDRLDDYGYTPIWVTGKSYRVGNSITNNGVIYSCLISHIAGTFLTDLNSSKWLKIQSALDVSNLNGQFASGVETTYQQVIDRIDDYGYIPTWVTGKSYRVGNSITKDGIIYSCLVSHTSGTFLTDLNSSKWLKIQSYLDVSNLNGQLASGVETTYQQAIDRLDDYGYIPSWQSSKSYRIGNTFSYDNIIYLVISNYTSSGSFSTDLLSGNIIEAIASEISLSNIKTESASGTINSLNVTGTSVIRLTSASTLNGILNPNKTKIITICNLNSTSITINDNSGSASTGNKILTGINAAITLSTKMSVSLFYDTVSGYWRVIGKFDAAVVTPVISTPPGYNDIRTSFTASSFEYEGLTSNGQGFSISGSLDVTGTSGWRYLVVDTLGALSIETIPVTEIVSDIPQFTPAPIFNVANNGYYSSVNTTKRIIAIGYFDGANMLETISYGNGSKKNDDYWRNDVTGTSILSSSNERLRFTDAMLYSRGSNITIVDNGYGLDDTYGVRVTNLENSPIKISGSIRFESVSTNATGGVTVNKNGSIFIRTLTSCYINGANAFNTDCFSFTDVNSQEGDYYTFYINNSSFMGVNLTNIEVTK